MSLKLRVGTRLRKIRKFHGLTQERLAELADLSVDAVSALERGRALPSFETLEKLAAALGVPIHHFFVDVEEDGSERAELLSRLLLTAQSLSDEGLQLVVELTEVVARQTNRPHRKQR